VQKEREHKLTPVERGQPTCHRRQVKKIEFRPGQLVYRKQMANGRQSEPKWLGPYRVIKKITDVVYRVQIGQRHANLNVEQQKLCRASREDTK
jgi:hypothetical protein